MIRITWSDTNSECLIAREQVCYAFLDETADSLMIHFVNGKNLIFDGEAKLRLHEALCNGIGHCTLECGPLGSAK